MPHPHPTLGCTSSSSLDGSQGMAASQMIWNPPIIAEGLFAFQWQAATMPAAVTKQVIEFPSQFFCFVLYYLGPKELTEYLYQVPNRILKARSPNWAHAKVQIKAANLELQVHLYMWPTFLSHISIIKRIN